MLGLVSEWILLPKPGAVAVEVTPALLPARTGHSRVGVGVSGPCNARPGWPVRPPDTIAA
jgi:hypothetical protein